MDNSDEKYVLQTMIDFLSLLKWDWLEVKAYHLRLLYTLCKAIYGKHNCDEYFHSTTLEIGIIFCRNNILPW